MPRVTVTGPNAGEPMDPNAMRALLEAIAVGVNNVDASQLLDNTVGEQKVIDNTVTAMKLRANDLFRMATLRTSTGSLASGFITFDGTSGSDKASRIPNETKVWAKTATYDWRQLNGSLPTFTATRATMAIFFAQALLDCEITGSSSSKAIHRINLALLDSGKSVSDLEVATVGESRFDFIPSATTCYQTITGFGIRYLSAGEVSRPSMGLWCKHANGTFTARLGAGFNSFIGALYLPR